MKLEDLADAQIARERLASLESEGTVSWEALQKDWSSTRMYTARLHKSAAKELARLPREVQESVAELITR